MEAYTVVVNGIKYDVEIEKKDAVNEQGLEKNDNKKQVPIEEAGFGTPVICGTSGTVWKITSSPGTSINAGEAILILEAMKMEIPVVAPHAGSILSITVSEGDQVETGQRVAYIE